MTDSKLRNKNDVIVIKDAGINAQSLSYLEMSLQEAMSLKLNNGEIIMVVKPEAWVYHKGLTFTKRTVEKKKYKDLYGIWFVMTQLGEISLDVQKALVILKKKNHHSWSKTFSENLKNWVKNSSPRDWDLLLKQDVAGKLKQAPFQKMISKCCLN